MVIHIAYVYISYTDAHKGSTASMLLDLLVGQWNNQMTGASLSECKHMSHELTHTNTHVLMKSTANFRCHIHCHIDCQEQSRVMCSCHRTMNNEFVSKTISRTDPDMA